MPQARQQKQTMAVSGASWKVDTVMPSHCQCISLRVSNTGPSTGILQLAFVLTMTSTRCRFGPLHRSVLRQQVICCMPDFCCMIRSRTKVPALVAVGRVVWPLSRPKAAFDIDRDCGSSCASHCSQPTWHASPAENDRALADQSPGQRYNSGLVLQGCRSGARPQRQPCHSETVASNHHCCIGGGVAGSVNHGGGLMSIP